MSWPFQFNFQQRSQFMSNYPQFPNIYYGNQLCPNSISNQLSNNPYNFSQNYLLYPPLCPQTTIPSYFDNRIPNINSNCNYNPIQHFQQEIKQNSLEKDQANEQCQSEGQSGGQVKMIRFRRRRTFKKPKNQISHNSSLRNDTKNIPKNYGKAMLSYIQKNSRQAKQLLSTLQVDILEFMMTVKSFKSKINTIHDLRQMWGQNQKQDKVKKCIRILSYHFMRKKCLPYIFNSRVKNYHTHIKYRKKIMQGIQNPQNFTKIKQF